MAQQGASQPLYEYGGMAWVWRLLAAPLFAGGVLLGLWGALAREYWAVAASVALWGPVPYFFRRVATGLSLVDAHGSEHLQVRTLAGTTRLIPIGALDGSRYSRTATSRAGAVYAPSVWLRVRGASSIYIDLLGTIHDRERLAALIGQPVAKLPKRVSER